MDFSSVNMCSAAIMFTHCLVRFIVCIHFYQSACQDLFGVVRCFLLLLFRVVLFVCLLGVGLLVCFVCGFLMCGLIYFSRYANILYILFAGNP